jgi:hypothetical protein
MYTGFASSIFHQKYPHPKLDAGVCGKFLFGTQRYMDTAGFQRQILFLYKRRSHRAEI